MEEPEELSRGGLALGRYVDRAVGVQAGEYRIGSQRTVAAMAAMAAARGADDRPAAAVWRKWEHPGNPPTKRISVDLLE